MSTIVFWQIGRNCNLGCDYCDIMGVRKLQIAVTPAEPRIEGILSLVRGLRDRNGRDPIDLVFYGGEPLLYPDAIEMFMHKSTSLGLRYSIHTNGTLLDRVDHVLLDRMDTIIVSVDGSKQVTDRHRRPGTYDIVRRNVDLLRSRYNGQVIARTTLTLEASIRDAVLDLLPWVDGVFWQIENSDDYDANTAAVFLARYREDLVHLASLWEDAAAAGRTLNILPLQAVFSATQSGGKQARPRCGCGTRLIVTDGHDCYACDEMARKKPEVYLGAAGDEIDPVVPAVSDWITKKCAACDLLPRCGGRCYHSARYFSQAKFDFYCRATRTLFEAADARLKMVDYAHRARGDQVHAALRLIEELP